MEIVLNVVALIARRHADRTSADIEIVLVLLLIIIVVALIAALVDYWRISQALTSVQIECLAAKLRSRLIYEYFSFGRDPLTMDNTFKQTMRSDGSFHWVDYPLESALSIAASHLKYKKHEWIVFLFCAGHRVVGLWCNKGPDSTKVSLSIDIGDICRIASSKQTDLVVCSHNHPNPYSASVSLLGASEQDLRSSQYFAQMINAQGMNFLDVVCERGRWLIYGESYVSSFFPYEMILAEIVARNGLSGADNRKLHRELRRHFQRYGYSVPQAHVPRREAG
ncbi:MAG: hypothetical protein Q7R41_17655 [Phycisphaerales bacterium]|nr:hypothetical protein [Phycisphaerales bacterium]